MRLDDRGRVVAAVVAAADDSFVPFDFLAERVFATREYQTHGDGC